MNGPDDAVYRTRKFVSRYRLTCASAVAAKAFETAYERTAALVTRHPQNADMLFERAQAEFWIGFTARRRGYLVQAREWLTRYGARPLGTPGR